MNKYKIILILITLIILLILCKYNKNNYIKKYDYYEYFNNCTIKQCNSNYYLYNNKNCIDINSFKQPIIDYYYNNVMNKEKMMIPIKINIVDNTKVDVLFSSYYTSDVSKFIIGYGRRRFIYNYANNIVNITSHESSADSGTSITDKCPMLINNNNKCLSGYIITSNNLDCAQCLNYDNNATYSENTCNITICPNRSTLNNNICTYITNTLKSLNYLGIDKYLISDYNQYCFVLQNDGNCVIYQIAKTISIWSTYTYTTNNTDNYKLYIQNDGNLVLYTGNINITNNIISGDSIWSSKSYQNQNNKLYYLNIKYDGNLIIQDNNNTQIWESKTTKELIDPINYASMLYASIPYEELSTYNIIVLNNNTQILIGKQNMYSFLKFNVDIYDKKYSNCNITVILFFLNDIFICKIGFKDSVNNNNCNYYNNISNTIYKYSSDINDQIPLTPQGPLLQVIKDNNNFNIYCNNYTNLVMKLNIFTTNTIKNYIYTSNTGYCLLKDEYILSNNKNYKMIYQTDGNLVIYNNYTPKWSSNTYNK